VTNPGSPARLTTALTQQPRRYRSPGLEIRGHRFAWGVRTYLMGIINTTPDSFSGDGLDGDVAAAVAQARRMEADGADWLDIGGESSRPGADELDPAEEARRVLPVLEAVRAATGLPLSIDTYHASVARRAMVAGADAINDIWGLRHDPAMASVVAETGAVLIAMHNQRGRPPVNDVVSGIGAGFRETLRIARAHGIAEDRIILDPGFGFGWTPEENLEMIRRLGDFWAGGFPYPLLAGVSRKSTIGHILGGAPVDQRLEGTAAAVAFSVAAGADIVRVHDVATMARVVRTADAFAGRGDFRAVEAVIALGSNLGDREANLRAAIAALAENGVTVTRKSSIWETAPVPADQPPFLNAVVAAEARHAPADLLRVLKGVEYELGRRPERRWGPRPIDLDILFYGDARVETPDLTIPHVSILERSFVLAPLAEVLPGALPVLGVTASEVLGRVGSEGLRRHAAL